MAKFEEEKVINALHPEKAEVGKKYWVSDELVDLKEEVEKENTPYKLVEIKKGHLYPFVIDTTEFQFLYPYEEPPQQRMTPRMLSEWLVKGNGQCKYKQEQLLCTVYSYRESKDEIDKNIVIRSWDSDEWIEPTVDIYERDCKGGK